MITLAKGHGLDVKVTIATMTLTSSIATSQHLFGIHYFPGTVIDTLHNLSLLLIRHLQSIVNLLIVQVRKWRISETQPLAQSQWWCQQENIGQSGSKPNALPPDCALFPLPPF